MGNCFITRRGGGSGKLFAAIGVTYPVGSAVTCTNGTKTLTAKTTSGQWVFAIPQAGTWTVTATDGTNTKSQSVEITSEGQSVNVTLSYRLNLYTNGVENVAWTTKSGLSNVVHVSKESTRLKFYTSENITGDEAAAYTPAIDLSSYNEVHVIGTYDSASGITIEVLNSSDSVVATTSVSKTSNDLTAVLDVSGITETDVYVRIRVACSYPGGAVILATVTEVYAE